jgi:hypothetical protein
MSRVLSYQSWLLEDTASLRILEAQKALRVWVKGTKVVTQKFLLNFEFKVVRHLPKSRASASILGLRSVTAGKLERNRAVLLW